MDTLLKILGWLALLATGIAPLGYGADLIDEAALRTILLIAMGLWFGTALLRDRRASTQPE